MSIDKIRQLEHQKNFQITNQTHLEFGLRWKWLNIYVEEFTTECFYPVSRFGCTKAVILPGIDSTTCLSFFQNGLIHTKYLEEQSGKTFGELIPSKRVTKFGTKVQQFVCQRKRDLSSD